MKVILHFDSGEQLTAIGLVNKDLSKLQKMFERKRSVALTKEYMVNMSLVKFIRVIN
jgi:hypothetical protein